MADNQPDQGDGKTGEAHVPIIALTAHAIKGNRESLLQSGFDGYVSKPINFEELCTEIKRLVAA